MWFTLRLLRSAGCIAARGVRAAGRAAARGARAAGVALVALPGALGRGIRGGYRRLRDPGGRLAVQSVVTVLAVAGALGAGYYLVPEAGPAWSFGTAPEAADDGEPRPLVLTPSSAPAPGLPAETDRQTSGFDPAAEEPDPSPGPDGTAPTDLGGWAASLAHLGIPERALLAYGRAELISAAENPGCNLSWTTLAGIGATESNHGQTGGNRITADGTTLRPIIGPEYNEQGPMQFLPSTWETWGADGNGDGAADPHNIDDATVAAANYLCHNGRDLSKPGDWYAAAYSYNPIDTYVRKVYDRADDYGRRSRP